MSPSLLGFVACALDATPPLAEASPAVPPAPVESVLRFDCQNANVALGHPEAAIQMCDPMPHLPGVFLVMLTSPSVSRVVVTNAAGAVETRKGPAVAAGFLDHAGVAHAEGLTTNEVVFALHELGGLPDAFGPDAITTGSAEAGFSSVRVNPFRLVLVRELPGPSVGPSASGDPAPPGFERATLTRDPDGWRWRIEARPDSTWVARGELKLSP